MRGRAARKIQVLTGMFPADAGIVMREAAKMRLDSRNKQT